MVAVPSIHQTTTKKQIVAGRLEEKSEDRIVLSLPETDYRLHLLVDQQAMAGEVGKRVAGRILARAMRVDRVRVGGRFIEPVFGRPRRLQGRVTAIDPGANTITVQCPCPITCELSVNQKAGDFRPGELVAFDVKAGTRFEPIGDGP